MLPNQLLGKIFSVRRQKCSHKADFFQPISGLLEQVQITFGNMVNIALENSTNLRKYDICYILILDW